MKVNDKDYVPLNSSMARNEEEVKKLGKQMEKLRTNTELTEDKKIPDPKQNEQND